MADLPLPPGAKLVLPPGAKLVSEPAPQTWAQKVGFTDPRAAFPLDLAEGITAGLAGTVFHGGDLLRRMTGQERIINKPEVQQSMTAPPSPAGQAGKFAEQVAETVIPGTAVTKGLRGAGMLTRIGTEAVLGGTQAAMQSGGDPLATGIGLVTGGAGGAMGGLFSKAKPTTAADKALDFLSSRNVPVSAGVRSGSPYLRSLEKVSGYSPLGAFVVKGVEGKTSAALSESAEQLLKQAHPVQVGAQEAGAGIRQTLTQSAEKSGTIADDAYDVFRQAEANPSNLHEVQIGTELAENGQRVPVYGEVPLPVNIQGIKKALQPIYDHMQKWWAPADRNASAGFQAIKSIISAPDHVPASVAEEGLSGLKQLAREGAGRNQGLAKMVIPQVQEAVDRAAAAAGPDVLEAVQAGRAATAQKFSTQGVLKQLNAEPVQAFGQLQWSGDKNIGLLRQVAREAPGELPKVGRAYLENVLSKATEEGEFGLKRALGMFRDWQNLGPETKSLMFKNPKLVEDLDNFFLGMKKLAENPNPSGSALTGIAGTLPAFLFKDPISGAGYVLGMGALAKMMYSPGFAKTLTQAMTTPAAQTARATGLFRHLVRSIPTQVLQPAPPGLQPAGAH